MFIKVHAERSHKIEGAHVSEPMAFRPIPGKAPLDVHKTERKFLFLFKILLFCFCSFVGHL